MTLKDFESLEIVFKTYNTKEKFQKLLNSSNISDEKRETLNFYFEVYITGPSIWESFKLKHSIDALKIKGNNIKEIIRQIKNNPNKKYYYINLQNKTYDDLELLKDLNLDDKIKINYDSLSLCSLDEFISMRKTIDYYKSLIPQNASNLEKITFVYDLIKSFPYEDTNDKGKSRNIHSIINDGKIVCLGYCKFIKQILSEYGIESLIVEVEHRKSEEKHIRLLIKIEDEKYEINDLYFFDPTFDSYKNVGLYFDTKLNNYVFFEKEKAEGNPDMKYIKGIDGLSLYKYFLITLNDYHKHFKNDKIISIKNKEKNMELDKETCDFISFGPRIPDKNAKTIDINNFIKLMYNVKLLEGYDINTIPELIHDIIRVSFQKDIDIDEIELLKPDNYTSRK